MLAQSAVAPRPVGVEVVANLQLVGLEEPCRGDILLAVIAPCCTRHRPDIYSVSLHGDGVGISLATKIVKFAGSFCVGSIGKGVAAYVYSDERLARHILWRHQRFVFLRCGVVIGFYLTVRLVTRCNQAGG